METFTLTAGVDDGAEFTGTTGNDTFNAYSYDADSDGTVDAHTLNALDNIDGGAGADTLNIVDTDPAALVLGTNFTVSNIETVNLRSATDLTADLSDWAEVTAINVTQAAIIDVTAAETATVSVTNTTGTIDIDGGSTQTVNVAGSGVTALVNAAGAVSVTNTDQGVETIAVDNGTNVTVTSTAEMGSAALTVGAIVIGGTDEASGTVTVVQNLISDGSDADGDDLTGSDISVTGGSTVSITVNATSIAQAEDADGDIAIGAITVLGDGETTSVTVTQNDTATEFEAVNTAAVNESTVITFKDTDAGEVVVITDGTDALTFTAAIDLTAAEVAAVFANLTSADLQTATGVTEKGIFTSTDTDGFAAEWTSGAANGATVTFTGEDDSVTDLAFTGSTVAATPTQVKAAGTAAGSDTDSTNVITYGAVTVHDTATLDEAITTVTLDGFASAALGVDGAGATKKLDALTTLTLKNNTTDGDVNVATAATTLTLNVENITSTTSVINLDHNGNATVDGDATVTDLTLNATGAASTFELQADVLANLTINAAVALNIATNAVTSYANNDLLTVDVNGAGAVNLGVMTASVALDSFNAAGNTGGVTATVETDDTDLTGDITEYVFSEGADTVTLIATTGTVSQTKVTLGAGNDTVDLSTGDIATLSELIDGGTGTNTIKLTAAVAETATAGGSTFDTKISNFSKLSIAAATSDEVVDLDLMDNISYVIAAAAAGTAQVVTLTDAAAKNAGVIKYQAGDVITITINGATLAYTVVAGDVDADDTDMNDNIIAAINADAVMSALVTAVATDASVITLTANTAGIPFTASMAITTDAGSDGVDTITAADATPNSYGLTLNNMAIGGTLELTDDANIDVNLTDATATTDSLNIIATLSTADKAAALDLTDIETLNVTVNDADLDDNDDGVNEVRTESLHLYANEAKTVTVTGNSNLTITMDNLTDEITTINASALTGVLTVTATGGSVMTVTGGSAADALTASGASDILIGGAGNDTLTGANLTTLTGGAGDDTFVMAVNSSINQFSNISDIESGDVIKTSAGNEFISEEYVLIGANLTNYVDTVVANTDANETSWFNLTVDGTAYTFIVDNQSNGTEFTEGTDMLIAIVGTYNLDTAASYNATTGTIEIA